MKTAKRELHPNVVAKKSEPNVGDTIAALENRIAILERILAIQAKALTPFATAVVEREGKRVVAVADPEPIEVNGWKIGSKCFYAWPGDEEEKPAVVGAVITGLTLSGEQIVLRCEDGSEVDTTQDFITATRDAAQKRLDEFLASEREEEQRKELFRAKVMILAFDEPNIDKFKAAGNRELTAMTGLVGLAVRDRAGLNQDQWRLRLLKAAKAKLASKDTALAKRLRAAKEMVAKAVEPPAAPVVQATKRPTDKKGNITVPNAPSVGEQIKVDGAWVKIVRKNTKMLFIRKGAKEHAIPLTRVVFARNTRTGAAMWTFVPKGGAK